MSAIRNISGQSGLSTLDVLWALYQSQPKSVKKAFRTRMEAEDNSVSTALWQKDLKDISALKDNWDEEGAQKINRVAIKNARKIARALDKETAALVRLFPTSLGAVMIVLETDKGRIKGKIGDTIMSYFVKRSGSATEHHSFEDLTKDNLQVLVENLNRMIFITT